MMVNNEHDESMVLLRQLDGRLATLRAYRRREPGAEPSLVVFRDRDIEHAEELADRLRLLVNRTARASAAERARVRAAVRYFVGMRHGPQHGLNHGRDRRRQRSLADELRVVDSMVRDLAGAVRAA